MMIETIKILAAISSIIGSMILAYRVTGILAALSLAVNCYEVNIRQLMPTHEGDIHYLSNVTMHVKNAQKKRLLITGFIFLILSGFLQFTALIMANI
ncbi:hypothetical protein [Edwardsiella tarda]|uniref:hypothetical protein n=1 Tax=Edwardsiella tarda TaxID=636 RepID=UPI000D50A095|nr:hypothetical protein [Edwardsiella tarda]UCQ12821.1 hypothetical protein DCF76_07930 [Edwardsiella tarda]